MAPATTPSVASAPPRLARVATFAALAAGIGGAGHAAVMGMAPDPFLLLGAFAFVFAYAWMFARERIAPRVIVGALVVMQVLVHVASTILHPHAGHAMAAHGHDLAAAHAGTQLGPIAAMLAVHVLATIAGSIVLLHLDRRAWSTVTALVRRVVAYLVAAWSARAAAVAAPTVRSSDPQLGAVRRWIVASCGRRGPPLLLA